MPKKLRNDGVPRIDRRVKGFLKNIDTVPEATLKMDLSGTLRNFVDNELDTTRYILLFGIRKNGEVFMYSNGQVSPLELDGLRFNIDDAIDRIRGMEEGCEG